MGNVGKQSKAYMDLYGFGDPSGRNQSSRFFRGHLCSYPFPHHISGQITIVPKPELMALLGGSLTKPLFFLLDAAWLNEGRCPGGRPSVS